MHAFHPREIVFLTLAWFVVIQDAYARGIAGEVNGRLLSFVDSLAHCASWVAPRPQPNDIGFESRLLGSVLTKHLSSFLTSLILRTTPTLLQGWEANVPFVAALALAHTFRFVPRIVRTRTGPWRSLFVCSSALYKLRRLHFAVRHTTTAVGALLMGILTMELTGWLAIAARGLARGQPTREWLPQFLQPRLLITLFVAYLCSRHQDSSGLVLGLLMMHKFLAPFNVETSVLDPFDESEP